MSGYYEMKTTGEDLAKSSGFQTLDILRPAFLMHGYLPPSSQAIFLGLEQRKLVTALKPQTKVPNLQVEDVGRFAAAALLEPGRFAGREINLAAENLTANKVAEIMQDVAGIEVKVPIAQFEGDIAIGIDRHSLYTINGRMGLLLLSMLRL